MTDRILRADLHVHSDHSGLKQLRFLRMRDCYSAPVDVYRSAKARGMDLVTLTDHDTIDGCLAIRDRRDARPEATLIRSHASVGPGPSARAGTATPSSRA